MFLIPAPGPGWLTVLFGLGLVGDEFLPVARALDKAELKLRDLGEAAKAIWRMASPGGKVFISMLVLMLVSALGFGVYALFFDGGGPNRKR